MPYGQFVVGSAEKLPFERESFDGVFVSCLPGAMRGLIEEDAGLRDSAIKEAHRVLKWGGNLIWVGGTQADIDMMLRLNMTPTHIKSEFGYYGDNKTGCQLNTPSLQTAFQK